MAISGISLHVDYWILPTIRRDALTIVKVKLVSTTDYSSGQSEALKRMIASIDALRSTNVGLSVKLYLLLQQTHVWEGSCLPSWVEVRTVGERISLSRARNLQLETLKNIGAFTDDTIVAFPDDDAWYPPEFMERLVRLFSECDDVEFFFCRYGSLPEIWSEKRIEEPSISSVIAHASSNTIFLRGGLALRIGRFDEDLGVNARYNGGEDTDYAIRAYTKARKSLNMPIKAIGHRDSSPAIRSRYFAGSLLSISRNLGSNSALIIPYVRKTFVGAYYILRGELTILGYFRALWGSLTKASARNL